MKEEIKKQEKLKQITMGIEVGDEQEQENSIQIIQKYYRGLQS